MTTDDRLLELLPHRSPMLLLSRLVSVSDNAAQAEVDITSESSFYVARKGVPSWVALEYMGQTAALIAGYQLQRGLVEPHAGFLLGTRKFSSVGSYFILDSSLAVSCSEIAVVGGSLATFDCRVHDKSTDKCLAECKLSVFRKAYSSQHGGRGRSDEGMPH